MVFGFGKKKYDDDAPAAVDDVTAAAVPETTDDDAAQAGGPGLRALPPSPADTAYERGVHGPLDADEIRSHDGYVDLGALLITPREGLQLRLEVEESTNRVIAVTLDLNGSSLQLQAFAAPRSEGLWRDIREQIGLSVGSQGGEIEILDGTFGKEVLAKLPAQAADGSHGYRVARFIGVDGPRWFLRGVFGGDAATDRDAAAALEDLYRGVVVVRGETPLPPRDLLVLRIPRDAADPSGNVAGDHAVPAQGGQPFRRGPEITQIG
ncbi:DUF3710 domain-containing protein [Specibacter cremeus]|uniref:DUF3710 domain-containing protein n=1 Tax=Specibacter cremeus TaxID=1629051 RepID=UPI000F78F3F7|nr:DUF3710 domain-containing protein [Specibacter cremeus]